MPIISKILFHSAMLLLMIGSIAGLLAGAVLVLRPDWLLQLNNSVSRWIATRRVSGLLEHLVKVDRWFYRHHQVSGIWMVAGAVFLIYFFTTRFDRLRILVGLSRAFALPLEFTEVLLDSGVLSILLGAVFALIVGVFLLIRPSLLRGFEQGANQWVSLRRALKPFEVSRTGVDEYVFQNVQMAGVLLLCGSLYTLSVLTVWL